MSPLSLLYSEKRSNFSKSVKGTFKKLKNSQCFRLATCYCGIFGKSGLSDIWYFRSDDRFPRELLIDLERLNFRTIFSLNYSKGKQFFHVGIFNGLRKIFWLIATPLSHCVSRFQKVFKKYTHLLTLVDNCTSYKNYAINASQTWLKTKVNKLISYSSENYGFFFKGRTYQHVMTRW